MPSLFCEESERWVSPYLNHFLQPDSIIPNPFNPQSFNRFSYVNNSPLNYSDPTGHYAAECAGFGDEDCENKPNYVSLATTPDPDEPDSIDRDSPDNVLKLYDVYRQMWLDKDGWWWDQYGSGGFSIWEFMAVMWGYEQHGFPNTKNYADALANHGSWWCGVMGCDIHTAEGAMQFMMGFSQVIPGRVKVLAENPSLWEALFYKPPKWWQDDRMLIVQSIQNGASTSGPNAPFDVGNISLRSKIFKKMSMLGMIHTVWGQPGEDPMIMLTYCQWQVMNYALSTDGARSVNMRVYRSFCGG